MIKTTRAHFEIKFTFEQKSFVFAFEKFKFGHI